MKKTWNDMERRIKKRRLDIAAQTTETYCHAEQTDPPESQISCAAWNR